MTTSTPRLTKADAGRLGARARWGDTPRVVRLDDLSRSQRRLVLALVDAARQESAETPSQAGPAS